MFENMKRKLEGDKEAGGEEEGVYGKAVSLQLNFLQLPREYQDAVAEKQSAEEDIQLATNERKQEVTKAETALLAAQQEARKIMDTAVNEAEVLLTEATLEAEETIFAFAQEAQTIVNVKESLNLTTAGVLAHMATKLVEEVPNLHVSSLEPARSSRADQL